ncbi:hypothetical protein [Leucobacter sp. G161]|uniref:hypothetical protein n=1 Tax=Leucobacter sp. G161 TaxID=663704 RepID=UPI00073B2CBF|nr:hypothetical protein [Leucobacter sp. G161]KUF05673.1 hypothetical protein AUL38_15880 [Leucobacter sp. G161]
MTRNHFTPRKIVHVLSHRYTLPELCLMWSEAVADERATHADTYTDAIVLQLERAGLFAPIERKDGTHVDAATDPGG